MNIKIMSGAIISIIVMVVLSSSILIPITEAESWETREYSNVEESAFYMMRVSDLPAGTYAYNYDSSTRVMTIDGHDVPLADIIETTSYTWAYIGLGLHRLGRDTPNIAATLVVTEGAATLTVNSSSSPLSLSESYIIWFEPTEYVMMKSGNGGTYVSESEPILFGGLSSLGGVVHTFKLNYYGAEDYIFNNVVPSTSVVSDVVVNSTKVTETQEVYKLSSISFTCTPAGGQAYQVVYSYGIAHASVTGHNSTDKAVTSMISVIPVMVFVGIVLGVVGSFIRNRD